MKIHEFQAKELLRRFGVSVPRGEVATTPEQAAQIAGDLAGRVIVKAQIHAGGRGKGGGGLANRRRKGDKGGKGDEGDKRDKGDNDQSR